MAKLILLCGKICSGKTTYCNRLRERERAVLLSCDEVESRLFHQSLGDRHDAVAADIKGYLRQKAAEIAAAGCSVVLDWGFWTRAERADISRFFQDQGVPYEWHYIAVSPEAWQRNIAARNAAVLAGETRVYYVDEGLLEKIQAAFEPAAREEMDFWYQG